MTAINNHKIIFDGDMGGDDLWALAVIISLVKSGTHDLIGVTTSFGNTTLKQATRNVCDMLSLVGCGDIPVYMGEDKPMGDVPALLDGAFGETGLSLANLQKSNVMPQSEGAIAWMADVLGETDDKITIIATGPATNLARLFVNNPHLDRDNIDILWFGGAISPAGGGHMPVVEGDGEIRIGNITKYAEFNAINDVLAAQILADLKKANVTFVPMDATQHMDIGLSRITQFIAQMASIDKMDIGHMLACMLHDVAGLDEAKFNAKGSYIHDAQVVQYYARPDLFLPRIGIENVEFTNDEALAKSFDAVSSGFNFSLLGHHGQMHLQKASGETNKYIVPGLTTFDKTSITDQDIINQNEMASARWGDLCDHIIGLFGNRKSE